MNKNDFAEVVAVKARLTKKDASLAVDAVFDTIIEQIAKGNDVLISKFGTFKPKTIKAKTIMNPKTEIIMDIPKQKSISFRPSKNVKDILNK